ncbi:MAG: hypothetical protein JO321_13790 [Solirubrobacterales bacterium]|nr:hypothetical protein [Solirubrobacterales bacterium]
MAYGLTGLLVVAGAVCAAIFGGETGQLVGFSLIGVGLILATGLVFLEVGLSEDRERAREQQAREQQAREQRAREPEAALSKRIKPPSRHKGPERLRGSRRRLR